MAQLGVNGKCHAQELSLQNVRQKMKLVTDTDAYISMPPHLASLHRQNVLITAPLVYLGSTEKELVL